MKRIALLTPIVWILAAMLLVPAASWANDKMDPKDHVGYFDFGDIDRYSNGEESIEVHLDQPLLSLVEAFMRREDPELAGLITELLLVKVDVFSYDEDVLGDLEKDSNDIVKKLTSDGWQRLVKVKQEDERVLLYIKPSKRGEGDEERDIISGLVVMVLEAGGYDDNEAVFVNIVGDFDIEAIAGLVERFDVPVDSEELEDMGITIRRKRR